MTQTAGSRAEGLLRRRIPQAGESSAWQHHDAIWLAALSLAAVIFYTAPWPALYLPALLLLLLLTWFRLDLAVLLVVAFAPAFMLPKHIGSKEFPPSEILLGIDVAVTTLWLLTPGKRHRFGHSALLESPFLRPALLFVAAGTLSTVLAADHAESFRAYRLVVLEPVVWFCLLLLLERRVHAWTACFVLLGAAAVAVSVIAIGQIITHHGLSTTGTGGLERARGLYGSPDNLGLLLDRMLPLWLAGLLFGLAAGRRRLPWLAAGVILACALAVSFSRGAWFAVGVAALALVWGRRWARAAAVGVVLLTVAGLVYKGPAVVHAFSSGHSNTVQRRLYLWQSSARMLADHPLVGVGPDNFLHYYAPRRQPYVQCAPGLGYMNANAWEEPCLSHPHNEFLDAWLSTGALGLVAFVWLQITFWRGALTARRRVRGAPAALLAGSMAAMLAALVHGLVDNSYFLEDLALIFWLLCAYVSFVSRVSSGTETGGLAHG